jgi:hypothetical protein
MLRRYLLSVGWLLNRVSANYQRHSQAPRTEPWRSPPDHLWRHSKTPTSLYPARKILNHARSGAIT